MKYSEFVEQAREDTVKEINKMVKEFNINTDRLTITIDNSLENPNSIQSRMGE